MKEKYTQLISELKKCKYKSTDKVLVHLCPDQIIVQTQKDAPDRLDNLIYGASRKVVGLVWGKNVSGCSGFSGIEVLESTLIN
ncbi:MAG: hypothetical protein IM618_14340 [Cytophagales bacterium]|nr:hypothetical protein [Cytophagales bacterium]